MSCFSQCFTGIKQWHIFRWGHKKQKSVAWIIFSLVNDLKMEPNLSLLLFFACVIFVAMIISSCYHWCKGCWDCRLLFQQDRCTCCTTPVLTTHVPTHRLEQLPSHQYPSDQCQLQADSTNIPSAPVMDSETAPPSYEEAIQTKLPPFPTDHILYY